MSDEDILSVHGYPRHPREKRADSGADLIRRERIRQVEQEGYSTEHDDEHDDGELALAAACYATPDPMMRTVLFPTTRAGQMDVHTFDEVPCDWPWGVDDWKPSSKSKLPEGRIRDLVKAGALIAAEIERLQRLEEPHGPGMDES